MDPQLAQKLLIAEQALAAGTIDPLQASDLEVRRIIDTAYDTARDILSTRRPAMEHLTRELLEKETIEAPMIQSILDQTQVRRIDIVGHSMGGLIGLYYIKRLGGHQRVRRLVMMGSPVRGTWAALLGVATIGLFSSSSWQLLPGSGGLIRFARHRGWN